ncbi:A disintegrin and metalloproteinase with thrombospondin motifs like [Ruditapes philippinarum]|uniref:A disintegrin and metalloproteinase with thrombospondin motifs like n=1 Tax=Ruditapes philippinarum TaxID=129788 RepID=UPI00295B6E69|nr:A disintegrin and metalloproteinase with thrombospondin motifs like [Ruditapes philippinarum]
MTAFINRGVGDYTIEHTLPLPHFTKISKRLSDVSRVKGLRHLVRGRLDEGVKTRFNSASPRSHLINILSQISKQHQQQWYNQQKYKRETTKKHYKIELEMLIADDIYDFWLSKMANNRDAALEKIEEYFEQIANMMDLRFASASTPTMSVDVVPIIITVIQDKSKASWITDNIVYVADNGDEAYNADKALADLYTWAKVNRDLHADALVCFSRRDMWSYGLRSWNQTVGIARFPLNKEKQPVSGLCSSNAVSLNEVFRSGDASASTTHELAHNMGVNHDQSYKDTSCPDDKMYIMAGTLGFVSKVEDADHPWQFSNCSISVMERLMSTIHTQDGKTCLERHSYDINEYNTILTSPHLGEIYSLDEQCEFLNGKGSRSCQSKKITAEQLCWKGLLCYSKDGRYCEYKNPLPGSNCGGTKKCYQGKCVDSIPEAVTDFPSFSSVSQSKAPTTSSSSLSKESTSSKPPTHITSSQTTTLSPSLSSIKQPVLSSSSSAPITSSSLVSTPSLTSSTTVSPQSLTSSTIVPTPSSFLPTTISTPSSVLLTTVSTSSSVSPTSAISPSLASSTPSSKTEIVSATTPRVVTTSFISTTATDYTKGEYEWLYYFYSNCQSSCYCWRSFCWVYKQRSLCSRFASGCYV